MVEPTVRQAIDQIKDEPDFQPAQRGISLESRLRLVRFFLPVAGNLLLNLLAPGRRRAYIVNQGEVLLQIMGRRCASIQGDRWQKLALLAGLFPEVADKFLSKAFRLFVSVIAAGMASWNFLNMLTAGTTSATPEAETALNDLVLQVTRGMPYNPTTEMDLGIWEMARAIKRDRAALPVFENSTASQLASIYLAGGLPGSSQGLVKIFLDKYGGRGLAEIDLGRTRWATDPTHLFEMLGSFLQITDESRAPDIVFAAGAEAAGQAVQELVRRVSSQPGGWIKAGLIRFFAGRARQLMGARENPKFFAVRMMFILQQALLQTGQEFVRAGELKSPDDLFYLSFAEMGQFAAHQPADWQGLIAERRASFERERLRRQIPRLLLSDGRAFYEGMAASAADPDGIIGSPVSPGVIEGLVRVVLDPRQAGLHPGEILVCPGTDPSWTPLFLSAGGLIMEVGGMMTHGAVVAREYGIPAIVGVHQATLRLKTGQRIRMDGSSGQIQIRD